MQHRHGQMRHSNHQQRDQSGDWSECGKRHSVLRTMSALKRLRTFKISPEIHEAAMHKDITKLPEIREFSGHLDKSNYRATLKILMSVEEAHASINLRKFDMFKKRIKVEYVKEIVSGHERTFWGFKVKGVSNGEPKLVARDIVLFKDPNTGAHEWLMIKKISNDLILFHLGTLSSTKSLIDHPINISFISSGWTFACIEKGLERANGNYIIWRTIFEGESGLANNATSKKIDSSSLSTPEAEERFDKLNKFQRKAVEGILVAECRPLPYILFGPPGTGKTHTLVEAIAQIYLRDDEARILFCANSNTCADQTVEKLKRVGLIEDIDIIRLSAGDKTDGVSSSRIVVTTNMKSFSLIGRFEFDYVFIDEAGHAHEPESLLPILSLKRDGCLVLAGDPKQLGPVVQCGQAAEYGLSTSMFERISKFTVYKRDPETEKYDNKYITKLLFCYRCDPRVLAISNKLFYKNELECFNETRQSILAMMNLSGPVQFNHVGGNEFQPWNSTSWLNNHEAASCVDSIISCYKMGFEPDQIGVITPYKLQARTILERLKKKLKHGTLVFLENRFQRKELVMRKKKKVETNDVAKSGHSKDSCAGLKDPASGLSSGLRKTGLQSVELVESDALEAGEDIAGSEVDSSGSGSLKDITSNLEKLGLDDDADVKSDTSEESDYEWVHEIVRRKDRWICKIDTVDAFQGNEREIIIISTVRTPSGGRTDFIDDARRFNVALSRAKWLLIVHGHKHVLEGLTHWGEYMSQAA